MKIIKLYVYTDSQSENGIGVKVLHEREVTKTDKTYSGNGTRLPLNEFEVPVKLDYDTKTKIAFDIWTTEENAKASVIKCVDLIIQEFESRAILWNQIEQAVSKAKLKIAQ